MSIISMLCGMLGCSAQTKEFQSVEVEDFANYVSDSEIITVDVRTASEYDEGHIEGAINIDVQKDDFRNKAEAALPKDKTIAVYCRSGRRSKNAANILAEAGYKVIELNKGFNAWTSAGKGYSKFAVDLFFTKHGLPIRLHCIKHGSLIVQVDKYWIYVDPVTTAAQPVTDFTTMRKAEAIVITHEHGDHLDAEAIDQLSTDETWILANPRSHEILGGTGYVMKNGESVSAPNGWSLDAVPAYNTSEDKQQFHPKGRDNGYIITIDGLRIYIAGDTEDIDEMQKLRNIDIAFLPCNLPFTMSPEQFVNAAKTVNPKILFPYHYGQTDIQQVKRSLEGSGIDVRIRQYQ